MGLVSLALAGLGGRRGGPALPPIVFVSRNAIPGDPLAVPGLGPRGRVAAPGGRLMIREPHGGVRELLEPGRLFDVSDPAVSFDGRELAFAGTPHPDSSWRIFRVGVDGAGLRALTSPGATRPDSDRDSTRAHDFDPCWIGERRLCFASTRIGLVAQYADVPVTNLYVVEVRAAGAPAATPWRITSERNGAEEPALDPKRGEIVFARWWFSRFQASSSGIADHDHPALPRDSVNLWQAVALGEHGPRLAFGAVSSRRATMAYQPAFLADGTPLGVYARNLGLWPGPGGLGIQRFPGRGGRAERIAGAAIPDSARHSYTDALGLAAPAACSPAALPDGRLLFAYAPGARGDFGIHVTDPGGRSPPRLLVDLPATLELDPVPVVRRALPRVRGVPRASLGEHPATAADHQLRGRFTYHSLDVFRATRAAPGAPPRVNGARVRFFAAPLAAAHATLDTLILIREAAVGRDGSIEARDLPADVPMFEQLVDANGRVLLSSHGPAHVAGSNAGLPGQVSRCVGCHLGHSAIALPPPRPARPGR